MHTKRVFTNLIAILLLGMLAACGAQAEPATPTLMLPTAVSTTTAPTAVAGRGDAPTLPPPATATLLPTAAATAAATAVPPAAPTATPTVPPLPTVTPAPAGYRVAFVTADDVLNVRAAAGVANDVVAALPPGAGGLKLAGATAEVAGSTWVQLSGDSVNGWVNGRFLTQDVPVDAFCQDPAAQALLDELKTAVAAQDDTRLAQLIHPERGLRVRVDWWNPEILIRGQARTALFSSAAAYDWGTQDGSGSPIAGPFAAVVLPTLQRDLLAADVETACNEILSGATAGYVRLPEGYEAVRYVSFFRPPDDTIGFDWGTWVVGVEMWGGRYYLSYLVHFDYEI